MWKFKENLSFQKIVEISEGLITEKAKENYQENSKIYLIRKRPIYGLHKFIILS